MTLIEAAYMALEYGSFPQGGGIVREIRKAIEEAERQEPEAWMQESTGVIRSDWGFDKTGYVPLYRHPPKREWQGLTDDELEVLNDCGDTDSYQFAKAIEAKLKEKNT